MSENDKHILNQSLDNDELDQIVGGQTLDRCPEALVLSDSDRKNCVNTDSRDIQSGGFANCAATVEEDSWCGTNDACIYSAVVYRNMTVCSKAYR